MSDPLIQSNLAGYDSEDGFTSEEEADTHASAPRSKRRAQWPMKLTIVGAAAEKQRFQIGADPTESVVGLFRRLKHLRVIPNLHRIQFFLCRSPLGLGVLHKQSTLGEQGIESDCFLFLCHRTQSGGLQPKGPQLPRTPSLDSYSTAPSYAAEDPSIVIVTKCKLEELLDSYVEEFKEHWRASDEEEEAYITDRENLRREVAQMFQVPAGIQRQSEPDIPERSRSDDMVEDSGSESEEGAVYETEAFKMRASQSAYSFAQDKEDEEGEISDTGSFRNSEADVPAESEFAMSEGGDVETHESDAEEGEVENSIPEPTRFRYMNSSRQLNVPSPVTSFLQIAPSIPSSSASPSPAPSVASSARKRRGKGSSAAHIAKRVKRLEAEDEERRKSRLVRRMLTSSQLLQVKSFNLVKEVGVTKTGWHGAPPPPLARKEILRQWKTGEIHEQLKEFTFVPYHEDEPTSIWLLDSNQLGWGYRAFRAKWMKEFGAEIACEFEKLALRDIYDTKVQRKHAGGPRGDHDPIIIGHYRQSAKTPTLTGWHTQNKTRVDAFMSNPLIKSLHNFVSKIVELAFPGIAQRFKRSAAWHKEKYGIEPMFGLFWNFCLNGIFFDQKRVHCRPHADSKNPIGVCVLMTYITLGSHFNSRFRSWLVIWEAGVIIQLPPWVIFVYPSSLFYHFNIDIHDIKIVLTENDVDIPTPQNSWPIQEGDDEGRGSVVYFNMATMLQSSESGFNSLKEAKKHGMDGLSSFTTQDAFEAYAERIDLLSQK